jgi:hypothetical protein
MARNANHEAPHYAVLPLLSLPDIHFSILFWDVTPCSLIGTCHKQTLLIWRWRYHPTEISVPMYHTKPYGATPQKNVILCLLHVPNINV